MSLEDTMMSIYNEVREKGLQEKFDKQIAKMLNQKSNSVNVVVRRIGGGFGGKETNFMTQSIFLGFF